jgi:hypothetical protein
LKQVPTRLARQEQQTLAEDRRTLQQTVIDTRQAESNFRVQQQRDSTETQDQVYKRMGQRLDGYDANAKVATQNVKNAAGIFGKIWPGAGYYTSAVAETAGAVKNMAERALDKDIYAPTSDPLAPPPI